MKLLKLNLKAVGPFTDVELDFSRGSHGLHVILGPNEAGKSSSLRALSYLFFGFPTRLGDNFLHNYDQLRVGASLQRPDGTVLDVVRRKATKNDLRAGDDSTILKPELLGQLLGNLDRESFEHRFGIDHRRLRLAGEEIRAGKGSLGEMLFAAGAGLAGLRQVQQTLQERSNELFKPRGQNQRINAALGILREAQASQKEHLLSSEEWLRHSRALAQAEEKALELSARIAESRKEQNRLDRLIKAGPLAARRRRLLEELRQQGETPRLRDDFGKEARAAGDAFLLAERTLGRSRAAIEQLAEQIVGKQPSETVLASAEEIEALQQRLGTVEKAADDRVMLDNYRKDKEHRARQILQELGRPLDLDLAENLRLRGDESKIIRALGQQYAQPRGQLDETRATIVRLTEQIEDSERELASLPPPPDVSGLRRAVKAAQKEGDLDSRVARARSDLQKLESKLRAAIAGLPGWQGTPLELQWLAVPRKESLEHFEARFRELDRRRDRLADSLAKLRETIAGLEAEVHAIERAGDVPLEADLEIARKLRDRGWRLLRGTLDGQAVEPDAVGSFLAEFEGATTLAEAYEESVRRSDRIGDRLRRESASVAFKSGRLSDIARHRVESEGLERDLEEIGREKAQLEREWRSVLPFRDDSRLWSVGEIRAWLAEREEVVQLIEKVQESREGLEPIEEARTSNIAVIRRALGERCGEDDSLAEAIDRAEGEIQSADDQLKRRDRLDAAIRAAKGELSAARIAHEAARARLEEWRTEWGPKMGRIGLEADANPLQAEETLVKLQELESTLKEHAGFVSRIKGIDRDEAAFRDAVESLSSRIDAGELAARESPYECARELARILKQARAVEVARNGLLEQRGEEEARLRRAEEERDESRSILERLCREAGCDDQALLAEVEALWRTRVRIEEELRSCEEQLLGAAAGADLDLFTADVESNDPDELRASHARLADSIAAREEDLKTVQRTIGAERAELARMDGSDKAAQAAERAQSIVAQIQGDVARFAALRLSSSVLRRAVDCYREKSQGPVLSRAKVLFSELTGGSFRGLEVEEDDDGRMILKGVRPDGKTMVGVEGMSDGSHDQLYLALRLASLETWLDVNEPIPFIVDDILMSFDDRRAAAALRALASLSKRTQVLFFTHHERLAELAEGELAPDEVFIQELPRRG